MNRPPSELLPAGDALGALLVPTSKPCSRCGATFSGPPFAPRCDSCEAAWEAEQAARTERAELRGACIPEQLLWATPRAPELRQRAPEGALLHAAAKLGPLLEVARGEATPFRGTPVVLLAGPAGAGKTSIACSMLRVGLERLRLGRPPVRFVGALELECAMREHRLGTSDPPIVAHAKSRPLVLLDDVGQESSDAGAGVLKDIVSERHARGRATIVTTGLHREELGRRYGGGFLRRVLCGGVVLVGCPAGWGDYGRGEG